MKRGGFLHFFSLFALSVAHMHLDDLPPCDVGYGRFPHENSTCMMCDAACALGTCSGPTADDCLLLCPVFHEDRGSVLLFATGVKVRDDDHNQIHMMEEAEFYIDDIDEHMDSMYVSLWANVTGTNITQHYYPEEGKLKLWGWDRSTNYDKVIATIEFTSTAPTPPPTARRIAFSINDGDFWSPEYVVTVPTVLVNNHPPSIDVVANSQPYLENGPPVDVFANVTVTDADHPDRFFMQEAMIWVYGNFSGPCFGEQLITVNLGSYGDMVTLVSANPAPMIHLRGSASISVYQHIVQTATFHSVGPEPPRGTVTIKVKIDDGNFTGEAEATLHIDTINDSPPRIEGIPLSEPVFVPGEGPVLVTDMVDLEDCDDNAVHMWTKVEASISIRTPDFVDEFLEVNTGSFLDSIAKSNETTQQHVVLIPSDGHYAPIADFEGVLRTLTYDNRNENISCPVRRIIRLKAYDGVNMTEKDVPVVIEANNQFRPVLSITRTGHSFEEDGSAVHLLSRARVSDRDMICDTLVMQGAQVNLTAPDGADDAILLNLVGTGITMASRISNGDGTDTIELTGNVDAHVYAAVIQSIRYENTKDEPTLSQRHIWISVFDGDFYSLPQMIPVDLVSRNDQPPVLNSPHMVYNFTENDPPVPFDSIHLTDADSDVDDQKANFVEVWIADQLNEPDEHLIVNPPVVLPPGITVTRISPSRVEIDGPNDGGPLSDFNQVLETFSYSNSNPEPAPGRRRILFRITSNAIPPANNVIETIYVEVCGVNDSPTWLDVSAPVNYTERSPPILLAPHAMPIDDDLKPTDVPIYHLEITVLGNEDGAIIDCPGCQVCDNISLVNVSPQRIVAMATTCSWSAAEVAAFARNVTFAIRRREPPKIADEVRVMFKLTDRDGLVGISNATVTVIHICDPGRLYLNATDMSTTAVAVFDEFSPETYVNLVEGPVMIRNNDSEIFTEIEVIITHNYDHGNDELRLDGGGVTTVNFGMGLRITGMFTRTEAENIITSIQFRNTYECRNVNPRTVTIRLRDDCDAWTNVGTVTINIRRNNDPPIVFPRSGSRQSIRHTYVVEGVANANPTPLHVFPYFEVDDCDGPIQGYLAKINVTIMDAPDYPYERIYFNETVLNMTGLDVKVVEVDEHVVRYIIYHPNGTAPIMYFERLIRSLYYINEAECPYEVMRKIIVTVSDGEDTGEGMAIIYYQRNPVGPSLNGDGELLTWTTEFSLLDYPSFSLIAGDVHFMHKAQITITNAIQSSVNDNFNDLVFIDPDDEDWVTSQGITISPDRNGPELILEYDGPVSNIDAAQFEAILRRVKFDSFDTQKNCDRRITVVVWDSPLKRMSNVITIQVVVGNGEEDPRCPFGPTTESPTTAKPTTPQTTTGAPTTPEATTAAPTTPTEFVFGIDTTAPSTTESPTTPDITTEAPTTPQATTEAPTTPQTTTEAPTTPQATTEAPTTPQATTEAPTTPQATTEAPTTPQTTTEAPTTPQATTEAPTTPQATTEAPTTPEVTTETLTTTASPTSPELTTVAPTTSAAVIDVTAPDTTGLTSCGPTTLTTQAQVDSLAAGSCEVVDGDLVISCDRSVENCFENFVLTGLTNIQIITGALIIDDNRLSYLTGLENVKSFKSLEIRDNTELITTSHLRMNTNAEYTLGNVESVIVVSQQRLDDVDGLKGIMTVTGDVEISGLQDLDTAGLGSLESIGGSFSLEDTSVTSLTSLSSLTTVGGSITIQNIDSLSSLEGLGAVTSVGSIHIQNNNDLVNFNGGLASVKTVTGTAAFSGLFSVVVYGNALLEDTSGFPLSLTAVTLNVMIGANPLLCDPPQIVSASFWNGIGLGAATITGNNQNCPP